MDQQKNYVYRSQFNKDHYKPPSIYPSPEVNEKWHQAWEQWSRKVAKSGWTGDMKRTKFSSFLQLCINTQLGISVEGTEGLPEIDPWEQPSDDLRPVDPGLEKIHNEPEPDPDSEKKTDDEAESGHDDNEKANDSEDSAGDV